MKKIERFELYSDGLIPDERGDVVRYTDHIAAMNTCCKCGANVTDWDDHIMTCKKSPAVKRIKELEKSIEYYKKQYVTGGYE